MVVDVTKTVRKIFISPKKNSTEKYFRQNCQLNIYAYWWLQLNWQKRERTKHGDERMRAALRNQRNKCFLVECSCVHKSGQFITFDQNPSFCPRSVVIKCNTVDCGTKTRSTKNPPSTTSETSNFPKASVSFFWPNVFISTAQMRMRQCIAVHVSSVHRSWHRESNYRTALVNRTISYHTMHIMKMNRP